MAENKTKSTFGTLKIGEELSFSTREAYNLLRANLYFALPETNDGAKVIGITSSCPQEGKSYTAINLAYTLAKDEKRVLLIDADMRKPTLAKKIKMRNAPGFSNLLVNQTNEVLHRAILHENLDAIFAGNCPPNPSELLGSDRVKEVIDAFKAEYDYIIFDLPPVDIVSDALALSPVLDGIAVVVRHGYSTKKEVTECIRRLEFAKVHILGYIYRGYSHRSHYYRRKKYYKDSKYSYYSNDKNNDAK